MSFCLAGSHTCLFPLLQSLQMTLAEVLTSACCASSAPSASATWVAVNGLLDGHGSPQQAATAAAELVAQGYTALKMKVGLAAHSCAAVALAFCGCACLSILVGSGGSTVAYSNLAEEGWMAACMPTAGLWQ